MNLVNGSVSACALAPRTCVGDVEKGLGLPQLGPPLQVVIYVGRRDLCIRACREMDGNKAQKQELWRNDTDVAPANTAVSPVCWLQWGDRTLARGWTPLYWGRSMGTWGLL